MYDEIQGLGGSVFLIGPETDEVALKLTEKTKATIPLLPDTDGAVIKSYKLAYELPEDLQRTYEGWGMNLAETNPQTGWMLPVPATVIVGPDGKIAAQHINADYTYRMEPSAVLEAVKKAAGK